MRFCKVVLLFICCAALGLRIIVAIRFPSVAHPDETFQYIEQAYRVVTGRGLVPWEYAVGARSWVIPGLLVPVIAAAQSLSSNPAFTLNAIAVVASLAAVSLVVSAYVLGRRVQGRVGGMVTALLVAVWPEIVLMSSHVLADTACIIPLLAGLAIGYRPGSQSPAGRGAIIATGLLLCFAALLRPQILPAVAVAALWIAGRDRQNYFMLVIGAIPALAIFGLVDWLTWGQPFSSFSTYVSANKAGVAALFGTSPFYQYVLDMLHTWRFGALLIAVTSLAGFRRLPLVGIVAAIIILTFSAVGHKEDRFIYPGVVLIFVLSAVGTVTICRWLSATFSTWAAGSVASVFAALWVAAALVTIASPKFQDILSRQANVLSAIAAINADRSVCGVAVVPASDWWMTGSVRFRHDITLYSPATVPETRPLGYNAILRFRDDKNVPSGFSRSSCFSGFVQVCVLVSRTPCAAAHGTPLIAKASDELTAILVRKHFLP